ncbi:MAG: response regulator [Spirochaetales bacterium]|nr:response regulator [Spirochaetales bacterium]
MVRTILLIENSEALSKSITVNLKGNGYETYSTKTITEGLRILSENKIELIIADINLGKSKIIDFASNIAVNSRYNTIPLIMLSNEEGKVSDKSIPGIEEWIIKPFSTDKLLKTVRRFSI